MKTQPITLRKILFWTFQILGWGLLAGISVIGKLNFEKDLNKTYIVIEGGLFFVVPLIFSSLYRWYIKPKLGFQKFDWNTVLFIVVAYVFTILGIVILLMASAMYFYQKWHDNPFPNFNQSLVFSTINIAVFLFFWTVSYISIKFYYKYKDSRLERANLEIATKELQLNTLKGQINPHFMFNSLNNIRALMLEDVPKAREMLTRLSEMLRYSLTSNDHNEIRLTEELEVVENYISLSKIQLEDRLDFVRTISPGVMNAKIPPMIIQMPVENAIKHGIAKLKTGGTVFLKINPVKEDLIIEISNTGSLQESKDSTKVGVQNMKQRLKLLYGNSASFDLSENEQKVCAVIKIPLSE